MANPHSKTLGDLAPTFSHASTNQLLWPLQLVLDHVSLSRSSWLAGVKSGKFPQPVRLSERRVAWKAKDIFSFVDSLETQDCQAIQKPTIDKTNEVLRKQSKPMIDFDKKNEVCQ
jgi:prophage regulatory protein